MAAETTFAPVCFVDTAVLLAVDDAHDATRRATARLSHSDTRSAPIATATAIRTNRKA